MMASSDPGSIPKSGTTYVDGLVSGNRWNTETAPITCSFHDSGLFGQAYSWLNYEMQSVRQAFQFWAEVANITFLEHPKGTDSNIDLHTTSSQGFINLFDVNAYGAGFGPAGAGNDGLLIYNWQTPSSSQTQLGQGSLSFEVVVHEVGHTLGLDRPHDRGASGNSEIFPGVDSSNDSGLFDMNQGNWTTMSYNSGWETERPTPSVNYGFEGRPIVLDVAAIQHIYGPNMAHNVRDDKYELPTTNNAETLWLSILDAGETDQISAENSGDSANIDLRDAPLVGPNAGAYVSAVEGVYGGFTIASGVRIEDAIGGPYSDTITGNSLNNALFGRDGADEIYGLEDDDSLYGGLGNNTLDGGSGRDWAFYDDATAPVSVNLVAGTASGGGGDDTLMDIERVYGSRYGDTIEGDVGDNFLRGEGGNDRLYGWAGNDLLDGGEGNDDLYCGVGNDLFMLSKGNDTIHEFDAGAPNDALLIDGIFSDASDALANATQVGSDTVFTYTSGMTTLVDVMQTSLREKDFIFAIS